MDDFIQDGGTAADVENLPSTSLWPTMAPEAFRGVAGRLVETIDPYSEASPAATLAHFLVSVGNVIGRGPHARVQFDQHPARLFAAIVGPTAKGRKGTSWSAPCYLLGQAAPDWASARVRPGASSGEGLIYHVRDAEWKEVKGETQEVDSGVADKRLLIFEAELASVFRRMAGDTNSLSAVLRQAWDGHPLATLTKNSPLKATNTHVSFIGHITADELRLHLTATEKANGFDNRFLFFLVKRSKCLPEGGRVPPEKMEPLLAELRKVLVVADTIEEIERDAEAREFWAKLYPKLSEGEAGLVGAMLARAEAQVLRLSVLYALLDCSALIRLRHLESAVAVWDFCEASVRRLFEGRLGLPMADMILAAIRRRGPLTRTQISDLFARHLSGAELDEILNMLIERGKLYMVTKDSGGRPTTVYDIPGREKSEESEKSQAPEISPEREERLRARAQTRARVESRFSYPWPDAIESVGVRHIQAFTACSNCSHGTWVFYGPWPLCLRCANLGRLDHDLDHHREIGEDHHG